MDLGIPENGKVIRNFDAGFNEVRRNDTDVFPIFRREAVHNEHKSMEAGRPIYDTVEMLQIIIPGDPGNSPLRRVSEPDKIRFADAYERFKKEEEMSFDGTPVDVWNRLEVKQVAALKHMGFFTVESIANVSDANVGKLGMGGYMLRDMAKAFVEASKIGGVPERLVQENARMRSDMDRLTETIEQLKHQLEKAVRDRPREERDTVDRGVSAALSHMSETTAAARPGELPAGWREYKTKEMIDLCRALDFAVVPRTRDEAYKLLDSHQGARDAARKS